MRPALILLLLALAPTAALGQSLTGNLYIHDPSITVLDGGIVSFATGVERAPDGGTPRTKTSPDGINWQEAGALPGGMPAWIVSELGFTPRNIWAPSVFETGGTHYLYYSASSFGHNDSAIGLMTNAALDPTRPTEGWVDQGLVTRSRQGNDFNAIDPFRTDLDGKAYLSFGSFWDGIRLLELDPASGKPLPGAEPMPIASRGGGAIEAPAIVEYDGRFYLFVSFDSCCRGKSSTYRIMVGRADAITGPYLDADGKPMLEGGGTELLATTGRYIGPGGQEVFLREGKPWLVFHYYDGDESGMPKLALVPIGWTTDGWPQLPTLP
ncbi:MAG: arabinan endo-1,5-alpha-L-arabinosidase [Alphaproteobacteria bacterium]|nr:arabinan endo-1,5-alpha-L-arabinosidase [Alphaproteobacteria bacterium]